MIVRLGYVAMSTVIENASPSRTMTVANFRKIADREAAVSKLERLASENLHNTLRLLRHNRTHNIRVFRFSSKLIPLFGHELLQDWDPIAELEPSFAGIGAYVREHDMRVSFHPDHFTVMSTPREEVLRASIADLHRHVRMLEAMGLDESAKCNIHAGGSYGDIEAAGARFIRQFLALPERIRRRITLENDDKTFNAAQTLAISEQVGVPMVLDIHHHEVNHAGESAPALWPRIQRTWSEHAGIPNLPPKIHASSPKDEKNVRSHADYIDTDKFLHFVQAIAPMTPRLDVMLEAKMKDGALFRLMEELDQAFDVRIVDQASFEIMGGAGMDA